MQEKKNDGVKKSEVLSPEMINRCEHQSLNLILVESRKDIKGSKDMEDKNKIIKEKVIHECIVDYKDLLVHTWMKKK